MATNPMMFEPEILNNLSRINMLNSPFYINIPFSEPDTGDPIEGTHIRLKLWVWTGGYSDPYDNEDEPKVILYKEKVNSTDTGVLFELSQYIKDEINPSFLYSSLSTSFIFDSICYWKYEYDIINNPTNSSTVTVEASFDGGIRAGVLGWNWDYQSLSDGYNSLASFDGSFGEFIEPDRGYNINWKNFNTTYVAGSTTSQGIIQLNDASPKAGYTVCAKEPWLIVYINKNGLWDYFTPTGKVTISSKIQKDKYDITFNSPYTVSGTRTHLVKEYGIDIRETILLNTGLIKETEGQLIEEILYSPKVYLIYKRFDSDLFAGYYNSYVQIPVIVTDTDFVRKTRLNDKAKISYNIKFEKTTNKIKNI